MLKDLWTKDSVNFEGRHYRYRDVSLGYKPVQQPHPPIWIAGVKTMQIVLASKDQSEQMRRIADDVLPAFSA